MEVRRLLFDVVDDVTVEFAVVVFDTLELVMVVLCMLLPAIAELFRIEPASVLLVIVLFSAVVLLTMLPVTVALMSVELSMLVFVAPDLHMVEFFTLLFVVVEWFISDDVMLLDCAALSSILVRLSMLSMIVEFLAVEFCMYDPLMVALEVVLLRRLDRYIVEELVIVLVRLLSVTVELSVRVLLELTPMSVLLCIVLFCIWLEFISDAAIVELIDTVLLSMTDSLVVLAVMALLMIMLVWTRDRFVVEPVTLAWMHVLLYSWLWLMLHL